MPSTYTLNNGIELIGTGEQSGTWGDTTNTNLSLLDTALDGQVTVTLTSAGTSGSPNTLAISDGAASDGRNRMVIFDDSSDLGATAYVQLTPNDAEKIIYVRNSLSGDRSILLFQGTYSASNDYELPAGKTAVIFFDGGGAGAVAANVFNNAHFDALNVVGGGAFGGAVTVTTGDSGATAASNADDLVVEASGDGGISILNPASNTGTLFFGDPSAGNMGQIKYSHTDDEMSIVTAQNTAVVIDSSRRVLIGHTSALTTQGGPLKAQIVGANATSGLDIFTGGASALPRLNFTRSRNATPGSFTIVQDGDLLGLLSFMGDDSADYQPRGAQIKAEVDGTPGINDMPGRLIFATTSDGADSTTERMRITSDGFVGIGMTPNGALEIATNNSDTARITVKDTSAYAVGTGPYIQFQGLDSASANRNFGQIFGLSSGANNGELAFKTRVSGTMTEAMRIDSSARVLIGTDTARSTAGHTAHLQVEGSGSFSEATVSIVGNENNSNGAYLNFGSSRGTTAGSNTIVQDGDVSGQIQFAAADGTDMVSRVAAITAKVDGVPGANDTPGILDFSTTLDGASDPTLRMRITNSGNVGIGTANPNFYSGYTTLTINGTSGGLLDFETNGTFVGEVYADSTDGIGMQAVGARSIKFNTNSSNAMIIDSVQRVSLGGGDVRKNYFGSLSSYYLTLGLEYTGGGNASEVGRFWGHTYNSGGDNRGGMLLLGKSRGTTRLSNTVLTSADTIYRIGFLSSDGTYMYESAEIAAEADGGMGSADVPGRLIFKTTSDGAASPSERMRIDRDGHVGLGGIDPRSYYAQELVINCAAEGGLTLVGGTGDEDYIMWADGTTGLDQYRGYIGYEHTNNYLRFGANGSEKMRLLSDGSALIGSQTTDGFDGTVGLKIESSGPSLLLTRTGARQWLQYVASDQSFRLYDSTDNVERIVVSSAGQVGINNVIPGSFYSGANNLVVGSGSGEEGITIYGASGSSSYLLFADGSSGSATYSGQVRYSHPNDRLEFCTTNNSTARLSVDSDGIKFNGDTAAANALDDYEEGSFTVYWSNSSASTNINAGTFYYTKIGRQVTVSGYTSTSNSVAALSGQVFLRGLPYAMASGSNYQGVSPVLFRKKAPPNSSGNYGLVGYMRNNTSAIEFWWSGRDNYEYNFMSYSQWYSNTSNNDFYITLTYFAA